MSCGVRSLQQVPWWDAERRARSALRAPHPAWVRRLATRLSAFRFLAFFRSLLELLETRIVRLPASHRRYSLTKIGAESEKFETLFGARDEDSGADRIARTRVLVLSSPLPTGESVGVLRTPFLVLRTPMQSIGYAKRG